MRSGSVMTAGIMFLILLAGMISHSIVHAGDLDDGISSYTDESIASDEELGSKSTNISFIIADAIGQSKVQKQKSAKDSKAGKKQSSSSKTISNLKDGKDDNNQNSVVVESGSRVENVYNIVIEK